MFVAGISLVYNPPNAVTAQMPPSCSQQFPNGLQLQAGNWTLAQPSPQYRTAFVMQSGTTAALCVTYHVSSLVGFSPPSTSNFNIEVSKLTTTPVSSGGFGYLYSYAPVAGVTSVPATVSYQTNVMSANISVVYEISASSSTSGSYIIAFTNSCPPQIPFVIGASGQSVDASAYTGIFLPSTCPLQSPYGSPTVTGIGELTTAVISQEA